MSTISEYNKIFLSEKVEGCVSKIHVIRACQPGSRFQIENKPPDDMINILAVGRLVEKKGFSFLIQAIKQSVEKSNIPLICYIVGSGPLEDELKSLVSELNLNEIVKFPGPLPPDEVVKKMAHSHMLVQPCVRSKNGDQDGIPNVLMEAMWLGVPVISTNISGIPELVEDGKTGLLADPENPEQISDAILNIISEPDLAKQLSKAGKQKVYKEFNVDIEAQKLMELFIEGLT